MSGGNGYAGLGRVLAPDLTSFFFWTLVDGIEEELDRLCAEAPERYGPVAERIMPLLTIQLAEMSKKLVRVSRQLANLASGSSRE